VVILAEQDPHAGQALYLLQPRSGQDLPDDLGRCLLPGRVLDDGLGQVLVGPIDA
jgi:hypothetical protein